MRGHLKEVESLKTEIDSLKKIKLLKEENTGKEILLQLQTKILKD